MQLNAVTGSDLLAFAGPQPLISDVRTTAFASREVVSLRDAYLASLHFCDSTSKPNIYAAVCASAGNTVRHKKDRILKEHLAPMCHHFETKRI